MLWDLLDESNKDREGEGLVFPVSYIVTVTSSSMPGSNKDREGEGLVFPVSYIVTVTSPSMPGSNDHSMYETCESSMCTKHNFLSVLAHDISLFFFKERNSENHVDIT